MKKDRDRMTSWWILIACAAALPLLWGVHDVKAAPDTLRSASLPGQDKKAAPDFELPDLNGSTVRLSAYRGNRPVLLYFWATWCPSCLAAKPEIAKLRDKIGRDSMEILGINVGNGDTLDRLKRYQQGHPVSWPVLFDAAGKVTRSYRVQGIPHFVLVDTEGNMVYWGNSLPADPKKYLK